MIEITENQIKKAVELIKASLQKEPHNAALIAWAETLEKDPTELSHKEIAALIRKEYLRE